MKRSITISYLILAFISVKVAAQTWSGTIDYEKSTIEYQVRMTSTDSELKAFFSSTDLNAYEIPCQATSLKSDSLHFYVISDYFTYEYQYLKQDEGFKGSLKVYSNETEQLLNTFKTDLIRENGTGSESIEKQELSFSSNNLELYGTLWKPENPINRGLLFVTSSQGNDRSANSAEAMYFANLGYTVFSYDKRGTGKSQGDWQSATIEELCSDDMNALAFFSKMTTLPLSKIGIKGSSQGGSKVPYILAKMPGLGFGISISSPSGTLLESDLNHWKNLNYDQIGEANLNQALMVQKAGYDYVAGNISYQSLLDKKNENIDGDWLKDIWIPEQNIQKDHKLNYSGLPYFEQITQPVLVIQGLSDIIIPEDSYKTIEEALKKSKSKKFEVLTLENTTHSMSYVDSEFPYFQTLSPQYLPSITSWLKKIDLN
jgi:uncharacterized protein